jgi:hypothetical protein
MHNMTLATVTALSFLAVGSANARPDSQSLPIRIESVRPVSTAPNGIDGSASASRGAPLLIAARKAGGDTPVEYDDGELPF